MAATGLAPRNPQQEDHALRTVKFARDCMVKMGALLDELGMPIGGRHERFGNASENAQ
jgi:hypothetical protein